MAQSKRRARQRHAPRWLKLGRKARISTDYLAQPEIPGTVKPSRRELERALDSIPDDLGWGWAEPRLAPIFERPGMTEGIDGDPLLNSVTPLGVAVGFGIDVGPTFARVTRSMAERWEASLEQIESAAFRHLADAVSALSRRHLQHAVHQGHMMRALTVPDGWASSVILAGEEVVTRIFGPQDQTFIVPARNMLVSLDARTPMDVVTQLAINLEEIDPHPLLLDPFVLVDGRLSWTGFESLEAAL